MMRQVFSHPQGRSHRLRQVALLLALAVVPGVSSAAQNHAAWTVDTVLDQLDAEAKTFHSLTAAVERTKVTVVVNDRSTETGEIYVRRDGKMRLNVTVPGPRTILRNGDNLYVFNPRIRQVEEYNLEQHRGLVDQFLLLGFGTPGKALVKGYVLTLLGEKTLDHSNVVWLELTPKSEEVRNQISKIQIWIDESSWLPIQQKFFETGTEDYFIIRYSNVVRNAKIPGARFKPHWPKGTTKIKH